MSAGRTDGERPLRVLFAVSEMVPYAKTGGLADVAGALPDALRRQGVDVRVCIPCYRGVLGRMEGVKKALRGLRVPLGGARLEADVLETRTVQGTPVYAVEREDLFDRPHLYGTSSEDYYDNLERFSFFSRAALLGARAVGFEPDVVHAHDWQTGLLPPVLPETFPGSAVVFTIHNLGYQGLFPAERLAVTGLRAERFFQPEGVEYWGRISLLKSGIVFADAITTVSPTYAEEIQTPEFGLGMEGVLRSRSRSLFGILNGADYARWDPETDSHLIARYGPGRMAGKARCKEDLIRETGLENGLEKRPLVGVISRLDRQKGLDILLHALDALFAMNVGLVVLGTGNEEVERGLQRAVERYEGRMALRIGFDESLAHRLMAGSDLFLFPSRYEPCGLTQMYAMKYGTVPVVRATGGLRDTVEDFDPQTGAGNGFRFLEAHPKALLKAVRRALAVYDRPDLWAEVQGNGMGAVFSWDASAARYAELFETVRRRRRSRAAPERGRDTEAGDPVAAGTGRRESGDPRPGT